MRDGQTRIREKERRTKFVAYYLSSLNATQAAIDAGYSVKTARQVASQLLTRIDVAKAIAAAKVTALTKVSITQDAVLLELKALAFSRIEDYAIDDAGNLIPAPGRPASVMAAISSLKRKTRVLPDGTVEREVEFRLWDKPGSLKLAGRHVGLFPAKDQAAIDAAALAAVDKRIADARREREAARTLAEQQEAERQRAIEAVEVPKASGGVDT
jgi:phage terminase small subunit